MLSPFVCYSEDTIRVLLVSSVPSDREAYIGALCGASYEGRRFVVTGYATNPEEAMDMVRLQEPEIIISDMNFFPDKYGYGTTLLKNLRCASLPFQPAFGILTIRYSADLEATIKKYGGDGYAYRHHEYTLDDILSFARQLAISAEGKLENGKLPISLLRGDLGTQHARWLRASINIKLRQDGMFSSPRYDNHKGKLYFMELISFEMKGRGVDTGLAVMASSLKMPPTTIVGDIYVAIERASKYAKKRSLTDSPFYRTFLLEATDYNLSQLVQHYASFLSSLLEESQGESVVCENMRPENPFPAISQDLIRSG